MNELPAEEVVVASLGMRQVHSTDRQLRVDAMSLAIQVHDKTRWGNKETTSEQYDEQLIATARVVWGFLTEQAAPSS